MFAFPLSIARFAEEEGMSVPNDDEYDPEKYVHFHVLCVITLGQPISPGGFQSWIRHNTKSLLAIPEQDLKEMLVEDLEKRDVVFDCW